MRRNKYVNVHLPVEIVKAVQDEINHPDSYYTSMADFVKEALREKLERLRATCVKPKRTS